MSKPSRQRQSPPAQSSAPSRLRGPQPTPAQSRRDPQPTPAQGQRALLIWGSGFVAVATLCVAVIVWAGQAAAQLPATHPGGGGDCRALPAFAAQHGGDRLSTAEPFVMGLALLTAGEPYRHPSWDDAGYLGPLVRTEQGDLFTAPVPQVSTRTNPPDQQHTIWRVDGQTGTMQPWLELPAAAAPSAQNPFGVLDLAYDCDTRQLYATTITGSTRVHEVGRIYQIDMASRTVTGQIEGIDAIGVAVHTSPQGKRLFFGAARQPELRSIALDDAGGFAGAPLREAFLPDWGGANKARRIAFADATTLTVEAFAFNYTLQALSDSAPTLYTYRYDAATSRWTLQP